ncbi:MULTISPECIES: response regulator [unclassified Paenibacillus]|uniref:response regulator n=1 Tax=unclassified Paenibacillus TaxID=185978 RepID=UPI000954BF61|nr:MULTISPECIES: response regulator [unclassified Paenibacillus]ASS67890.1 response regulator [Paenibacillus sp. RUD330]SIR44866.1 two-component system, response regulator YesN [Paenibacillus sp. RU4X]SIR54516.1 two-component system, response regulator YesN [Paenibacillus sp. RU4T]
MIRVLIVDDDKLARKGLISIMPWSDHDMIVVGEAANGAKALEFMDRHEVDLMFVDLSMPVMSGMELLQVTRQRFPGLRSVILSFHEEFENVQTAYRMGVLDYISKVRLESEDDEQILKRIRLQMAGEMPHRSSKPSASASPAPAPEQNNGSQEEEAWSALEQEWRSLYWLYNESVFQRLCKQTAEAKVSFRRLEGLWMRVLSQLESAFALSAELRSDVNDVRSAIEWLRDFRKRVHEQVAASADLANTTISILKAALFIREQASSTLHAEDVADHVHMSRSYFSQCFKKLTGSTFNEYLRQERIRAAERLLCETNQSIAWVAHAVGYNDSKYFSQLFYEQTRLLPSEFRAQFHKGDE